MTFSLISVICLPVKIYKYIPVMQVCVLISYV